MVAPIDWSKVPDLGKTRDRIIAKRIGCLTVTVGVARRKLGIPHVPLYPSTLERFNANVDRKSMRHLPDPLDCWMWLGCRAKWGCGLIGKTGEYCHTHAHRYSWEIHRGPIPEGMQVLHRCDNPPCVNPDHLWVGSNEENHIDKVKKNRQAKGEQHHNAVLTSDQVLSIRRDFASGLRPNEVSLKYGVSYSAVVHIRNGATWKHLL